MYNKLVIRFDQKKETANIAKHGLGFADCETIFDYHTLVFEDSSETYGEQRLRAYGYLKGVVVCLVYLDQDDSIRVISLRKATKYEIREYLESFSH